MEKSNKWLLGVLTTLSTGLILWWLTHEGGPLNPGKPAHVAIITWDYSQGKDFLDIVSAEGQLTVHNDGESTAENCSVYDKNDQLISGYTKFGVPPKEDRTVPVWVNFRHPKGAELTDLKGSYGFGATARVKCDKSVSSSIFSTMMWLK